jgi:hypothetical protein
MRITNSFTRVVAVVPVGEVDQSPQSLWLICQRLAKEVATSADINAVIQSFSRENKTFAAAWRSHSYRWSELCFYVLAKLEDVGQELINDKRPMSTLHTLFLSCEEYLVRAKSYESHTPGTYNYSVRLIQSLAARQWSLHANVIDKNSGTIYDSLFLFRGRSKVRSAQNYALQAIEDLKPVSNGDAITFMFETHDAVRSALGTYSKHIMTLNDFHYALGQRGWQGIRVLVDDFIQTKIPTASHANPLFGVITSLKNTPSLASGLAKVLADDRQHDMLKKTINQGFFSIRALALANTALDTAIALAAVTVAAVKLAGMRPPEDQRKIKIVGEDERVQVLSILLQHSPNRTAAVRNAVMAYSCTPYVGGDVDQSRAQSVFIAAAEWMI